MGLSGATLEGRVRRAATHVSDATFAGIAERLRNDAFANDMIYERDGTVEPIRIMLRPLLAMEEQFRYVHYVCQQLTEALKRLPTLFLQDDEVRRVLAMVLEPHHEVSCVEDGGAALALLEGKTFDVVLCDLMMPGMSGSEVYDEVRRRHPGLERRIVFVTGGAFVSRLGEFLETVDNLKLLKPFDVQQVLNAVRSAADR